MCILHFHQHCSCFNFSTSSPFLVVFFFFFWYLHVIFFRVQLSNAKFIHIVVQSLLLTSKTLSSSSQSEIKIESVSHSVVYDHLKPMDCSPPGFSVHGNSPGKNTEVGFHTLLQGIFQIQGSNPGLLCCRQILYCLSHQGSPFTSLVECYCHMCLLE